MDDPAVDHAQVAAGVSLPQPANEAEGEIEVGGHERKPDGEVHPAWARGRRFDLLNDPGETVNQAEEAPEAAASAREILNVVIEGEPWASAFPSLDASTTDALKALGYVE